MTTSLRDRVEAAVAAVPDPELPPVTLGMLGMVHAVTVDDGAVRVELLPTFAGCPATDIMERDVTEVVAAVEGVERVTVRFRYDPPWTPDRIDDEGRQRLREFGIAPPGGPTGASEPDGRMVLPLLVDTAPEPRPCPYCGSSDTVREASFGPTPCRDVRFCSGCQQPFEAFKS